MDERLRQTSAIARQPERDEGEKVNPEFERDADRLAFQLKPYTMYMFNERFTSMSATFTSQSNLLKILRPTFDVPSFYFRLDSVAKSFFLEEVFELYEKTINVSQLYKLAGNFYLAEKYKQDAEKIYTELQQFEDKIEKTWRDLQYKSAENGAKRGIGPKYFEKVAGPIWNFAGNGRHTLPTSGHLEGAVSTQKASEGGRKTRKNKVLHKR
jgi:hypothetical protein